MLRRFLVAVAVGGAAVSGAGPPAVVVSPATRPATGPASRPAKLPARVVYLVDGSASMNGDTKDPDKWKRVTDEMVKSFDLLKDGQSFAVYVCQDGAVMSPTNGMV